MQYPLITYDKRKVSIMQIFSTSRLWKNSVDFYVTDGTIIYIREAWSDGANERMFYANPGQGRKALTYDILVNALVKMLRYGDKVESRKLYECLNKDEKILMKKAQERVIEEDKDLL